MIEPYVKAPQVAAHLGLSTSRSRKKTTDTYDPIPHHRLPKSRSVLYRLSEVDEWVLGSGRDA